MKPTILSCRIVGFFWLAVTSGLSGQVTVSTPVSKQTSANQAMVQAYQQQQSALMEERETLIAQGATEGQLMAWEQQNSARFDALQQQAKAIATATALQLYPANIKPNIPANASHTLANLISTQTRLLNSRAEIHNELVQSMPSTATADQVNQMQQQEMQAFQQGNPGDLQVQAQLAQTVAIESAKIPLAIPGPTVIPPDTTAQLGVFLTLSDQLMRGRMQLWNQNINADPSVRQAAMLDWQLQNAVLLEKYQQQAQDLALTVSSTPN